MAPPKPPPASVLSAFSLSGTPVHLPGGQNTSFLLPYPTPASAAVVLKPVDNPSETAFLAPLLVHLHQKANPEYRVSLPLSIPSSSPDSPPQYIASGWTATYFLPGVQHLEIHLPSILPATRPLHADLRELVSECPACIPARTDRWALAERVAWGELSLPPHNPSDKPDVPAAPNVNAEMHARLAPLLARLFPLRRPLDQEVVRERSQIVHGDLSGNILFCPPALAGEGKREREVGIIDFSLYWRPVGFAEAIMVADGMTWKGWGREEGDRRVVDWVDEGVEEGGENRQGKGEREWRIQMLVRALIFRVATYCIDVDSEFVERNLGNMDVDGGIVVLEKLMEGAMCIGGS